MNDTTEPADPVVWEAPDPGTWELEANHGTDIGSVTLRDQLESAFADGFRNSFSKLGVPLSHIEIRHVNGWPYVSFFLHDVPRKAGKPPPAIVLKAVTRIHPGFRRRTRIAEAAIRERRPQQLADEWFDERTTWIERLLELQKVDLDGLESGQLADHVGRASDLAIEAARRHFELVAGSIPLGEWLARAEAWGLVPAKARLAVMHGTPVHAEAHQRLERIAGALGEGDPIDLDQIRAHGEDAAAAVDDYLAHHGWWSTEDRLSSPQVRDFPEVIVYAIREASITSRTVRSASDGLEALRSQVPDSDRDDFDRLADDAKRAYAMLDDNSGILGSWATGVAGHVIKHAGGRLVESGSIHQAEHIWALDLQDIIGLLTGHSSLSANQVTARYRAWQAQAELDPPPHLNGPPSPPPDPGIFPAPVAQLVTSITTFLADKFNDADETIGIGDVPVQGRAVVASNASDAIARIQPGDILVTTATTPAYNTILPIVAGIIVSQGGPSCHAAIVARELNVPAIVGYTNATSTIPDGSRIELDPTAATVRIITSNETRTTA